MGTLAALDSSGLFLRVQTGQRAVVIPLASVTALEVSRGQKSKVWLGAGVGFLIGATTGAILGFAEGGNEAFGSAGNVALAYAIVLGVPGAFAGAFIGAGIKVEQWEAVPLDQIDVSLTPTTPDGFAVTVRVTSPI